MQRLVFAVTIWLGLAVGALAQSRDVEATIGAQIEAFRADDFATAFTFASPMIQGVFRTPENFGVMVREGYPMVWRPAQVRYLELREIDGALWQKLAVTDAKGAVHVLDYQMIETGNGWKINAVQVLPRLGVAA